MATITDDCQNRNHTRRINSEIIVASLAVSSAVVTSCKAWLSYDPVGIDSSAFAGGILALDHLEVTVFNCV